MLVKEIKSLLKYNLKNLDHNEKDRLLSSDELTFGEYFI